MASKIRVKPKRRRVRTGVVKIQLTKAQQARRTPDNPFGLTDLQLADGVTLTPRRRRRRNENWVDPKTTLEPNGNRRRLAGEKRRRRPKFEHNTALAAITDVCCRCGTEHVEDENGLIGCPNQACPDFIHRTAPASRYRIDGPEKRQRHIEFTKHDRLRRARRIGGVKRK